MFQTFDNPTDAGAATPRTRLVREVLKRRAIDAFLVPRADEHQGEYVAPSAERLRWLTGFSGSAGLAIVAINKAVLFVDGRYTVQARSQVPGTTYDFARIPQDKVSDWLTRTLRPGAVVGFDPWLHTAAEITRLTGELKLKGLTLRPVARNPVDEVWGADRPAPPSGAVHVQPVKLAGMTAEDKIARLQERLAADGQDAVVLTLPDSICWLFNIRGSDVAHNPVVLAFAIVPTKGKPELFIASGKVDDDAKRHLSGLCRMLPPAKLGERLDALKKAGKRVRVDPASAAWAITRRIGGAKHVVEAADPCIAAKARKTTAELAGARTAHVRDGAAMARFLSWLDREAPQGTVDEIGAATRLEQFRAATTLLKDLSFDTISGAGPNGAIVHYRVTRATNRKLARGDLYLVDSGGQYADGTTDVTRTIAIGKPSDEMRQRYTLVLKGHITISTARFPKDTRGIELDPFARRPLWQHGLDYDHGTGHGIGSFLSVHEGPQSISRRGMAILEPGMICSNEPGYYKEGAYGIRIENLVIVTEPKPVAGGDRAMMAFETITFVPYDRNLIDLTLLTPDERAWVNDYHAEVRRRIAPALDAIDRAWLDVATAPL